MGAIWNIGETFARLLREAFPLIEVVECEEYVYDWEYDSATLWGAHAIVTYERKLFGTITRHEEMVKVNKPDLLIKEHDKRNECIDLVVKHFEQQQVAVISLTILGEDGQQEFFPLAA